jgi:hypothetical protein
MFPLSNITYKNENLIAAVFSATVVGWVCTESQSAPPAKAPDAAAPAQPARAKPTAAVGPVVSANMAMPITHIKVLKEFKVEHVYFVPGGTHGSWLNPPPAF